MSKTCMGGPEEEDLPDAMKAPNQCGVGLGWGGGGGCWGCVDRAGGGGTVRIAMGSFGDSFAHKQVGLPDQHAPLLVPDHVVLTHLVTLLLGTFWEGGPGQVGEKGAHRVAFQGHGA